MCFRKTLVANSKKKQRATQKNRKRLFAILNRDIQKNTNCRTVPCTVKKKKRARHKELFALQAVASITKHNGARFYFTRVHKLKKHHEYYFKRQLRNCSCS